ncbi:GntR family transcriptional regulator [Sphingomonas oligophenolica]|uniref:GntR family transcriptional regulator n=1 Tax=Sphingomonas oligophenolica TaxID=301154 RepID=A0A502C6K5_9SPHN|nr:GntR family transcriptional regulator [Sphingomonas oligophenolica]TPG08443.1 GntR family transcriptional regulator [Sphingomonas oligophenolica]
MAVDTGMKLAPLRYESAPLRNQIIAALRSAIEAGILKPGTRLIERDLCEQLNVSRTSLREALRELQALGVLSHTANRGLMVGTLTREDASNAYSIRSVLEALVARQFIDHAIDDEFAQLASLGLTLKKAYRSGSVEQILKAKRAFYDCLCSGARNNLAFDFINRLTLRTSQLRSTSLARKERQQQSVREIDAILAAIAARDAGAASDAAHAHVESAAASAFAAQDQVTEDEIAPPRRSANLTG